MTAIAEQPKEQPKEQSLKEPEDAVAALIDQFTLDEMYGDIAEIINENFVLEVEASRSLSD